MKEDSVKSRLRSIMSCSSARDRAIALLALSLVSLTLAVLVDYFAFLVVGYTSVGTWYNQYWIGFFFTCGIIISAFFVFRHSIKTKPENLFLVIVLAITCFSSIAFDVNKTSWDADYHYRRVVEWSKPGMEIELSVADARMIFGSTIESYFGLDELSDFSDELDQNAKIDDERTISSRLIDVYIRIAYLPASLVFSLCSLLGIPFTLKYILSRLIYALIYSFVVYLGMRQLKSGKMLFAVIALLPTALFLTSNYGYDYWINAFVLLGGACLVRELQTPDEKITKGRIAILLGSFVIGFGPKVIYAPVILLCLLIPKSKFLTTRGSKLFRAGVVITCIAVGMTFLAPYIFTVATVGDTGDLRGGNNVNASGQIAFILSNPLEYIRILFSFLAGEFYSFANSREYITSYAYLASSSWPFWIWTLGLMFFTAITDKSDADRLVCTWKSRTLAIAVHIVTMALVATALYISFTPVGLDTINGVQPRYLIPLLFCCLVFLSDRRLAWPRNCDKKKTAYNVVVLGSMSAVYMFGFWQVYISFLH